MSRPDPGANPEALAAEGGPVPEGRQRVLFARDPAQPVGTSPATSMPERNSFMRLAVR